MTGYARWVTPRQAAYVLKKSVRTVYRLAEQDAVITRDTPGGMIIHLDTLMTAEANSRPGRPRNTRGTTP